MHQKVKEWFNNHGQNLAMLKIKGGSEIFKPEDVRNTNGLTMDEWAQFLILTGQLDALIWIFHPDNPDEALSFVGEITELMEQLEEEAELIQMTGMVNIPKGEA